MVIHPFPLLQIVQLEATGYFSLVAALDNVASSTGIIRSSTGLAEHKKSPRGNLKTRTDALANRSLNDPLGVGSVWSVVASCGSSATDERAFGGTVEVKPTAPPAMVVPIDLSS